MYYCSIDTLNPSFVTSADWTNMTNHKWYLEEKIDGSQLSIVHVDGEIGFFNKNNRASMNDIFGLSIEELSKITKFNPTFSYHGEAISKPKHNVIEYQSVPLHNWICFDIYDQINGRYLDVEEKRAECARIGVSCIQIVHLCVQNENPYQIANDWISKIETGEYRSMLGGKPEGVVLKHTSSSRIVLRKLVAAEFRERHRLGNNKMRDNANDFIRLLGLNFNTEGRFRKILQQLREKDLMVDRDQNIIRAHEFLDADFDKENKEEIMQCLWRELGPIIKLYARHDFDTWFAKLPPDEQSHEAKKR